VNDLTLIRKNLFRRKLRAILMIVSILIAFAIYGVLASFERAFNAGQDRATPDSLVVLNKISPPTDLKVGLSRLRAVNKQRHLGVRGAPWTRLAPKIDVGRQHHRRIPRRRRCQEREGNSALFPMLLKRSGKCVDPKVDATDFDYGLCCASASSGCGRTGIWFNAKHFRVLVEPVPCP